MLLRDACCVLALLACLLSCTRTAQVTFELAMAAPVRPDTADSQWALFTWCLDSEEAALLTFDRARAREIQDLVGHQIFDNWCKRISVEFPFLSILEGDLFFTGEVQDKRQIRKALEQLKRPIKINPSLNDCRGFFWAKNLLNSGFPAWLEEHGDRLQLPEGIYGDRTRAAAKLLQYSESYLVSEAIRESEAELAKQDYKAGFRRLRDGIDEFPTNTTLLAKIAEVSAQLIRAEIQTSIQGGLAQAESAIVNLDDSPANAEAAEKLLATVEQNVATLWAEWNNDMYLARALTADAAAEAAVLQRDVAASRARIWQREFLALTEKQRYWTAYDQLRSHIEQAQTLLPAMRDELEKRLWETYIAGLPTCIRHFLDKGTQEMEDAERHGITLTLCNMARDLLTFAQDHKQTLPAEMDALRQHLEEVTERSTLFFDNWIKRALILSQFTAGEAGLGTTFQRDMEILFRQTLADGKVAYGVEIAGEDHPRQAKDYVLDKCNIAAFEADKGQPEEVIELLSRSGEVIEADNPEYIDRVKKKKITTGIPPKIITQKIYKYTKHISTVKVVVHTRLTFGVTHRDKENFFEVNKFLQKTFIKEIIDPRETIVKTEKVVGPVEAPPTVRDDTIWVPSEMKDWARQEAQNLLVSSVIRYIANYPIELATEAESFEQQKQYPVASNLWGFCVEYCKRIQPNPDDVQARLRAPDIEDHTKAELEESLLLIQRLKELKDSVWGRAVKAVAAYQEPTQG